ncbi:hypothetical protein MANI_002995 [Metarhizium anisopliae]
MHSQILFETFTGKDITDAVLEEASTLFSENYGIWGKGSSREGKRVRLSGQRLREKLLPESAQTSITRVAVNGNLAGHAFVCRWACAGKKICWITQLVIGKHHREQGLATCLLTSLRKDEDDVFGIMSSHPAACLTAAKAFGRGIEKVSLDFISENAAEVVKSSPIPYIRDAELCGSLFNSAVNMVSGANTHFFVDHKEPLDTLRSVRRERQWPLGELQDGYEYLLILPSRPCRSRS